PRIRLPAGAPPGVGAILAATLARPPESLNTDWFGTTLLQGLLRWSKRGACDARDYAEAWLAHQAAQETVSRYQGPKSRLYRVAGVPITTYAGHYGLAMPCYEMAVQFGDARAKRVCVELAGVIAGHAHRNPIGLIDHDDSSAFAIPDACYFIVTPLMLAAELDPAGRAAFHDLAADQLRRYTDTFLVAETGLARTIWRNGALGQTYWTRASGWLLWAMTSVLRYLPENDPRRPAFLRDLGRLAAGVRRRQDPGGGFHVLLDDPTTPLETTGTAMFATGVHEAARRGWLREDYGDAVARAWQFVRGNITADGNIVHAFTGWAGPAEQRRMVMDHQKQEWVPGFILRVADEMTPEA
ncbi:MAG TPA: glycoside hydrolase family 88 protein, partial [Opitutus sp.]|nr:glycoside hydrolase family 88 protein [Opitutus sp.]